jgi:hypothetical protein
VVLENILAAAVYPMLTKLWKLRQQVMGRQAAAVASRRLVKEEVRAVPS